MTEQEAIAKLRLRDPAGLAILVELHQVRALRLAFTILRNRADAEDAVADAFIAAYDDIDHLRANDPFQPWFTRVVVNRSLSMLRRSRRTSRIMVVLQGHRLVEAPPDPAAVAERQEMNEVLRYAVDTLPPKERVALILRYYLDLDERTIAQVMACPLGTVKTRLRRGRLRLQSRLPTHSTPAPASY